MKKFVRRVSLSSLVLSVVLGACVESEFDAFDDPEFREFQPADSDGLDDADVEVSDPAPPDGAGNPEVEPVSGEWPTLPNGAGDDACNSTEDNETCTRSGTGAICSEGRNYVDSGEETDDKPILENMDDSNDRVVNCGCGLYTCTVSPMATST